MSNYKPFMYSIIAIFGFSLFVTLVISPFVDTSAVNPDSILAETGVFSFFETLLMGELTFTSFMETISFPEVDIEGFFGFGTIISVISNAFLGALAMMLNLAISLISLPLLLINIIPESMRLVILEKFTLLSWVPDLVLIPALLLIGFGLIWSILKLILA